MNPTTIANVKYGIKGYYVYIGRKNKTYSQEESIFHNPFIIGKDGDRAEVICKFEEYAKGNKKLLDSLYIIDGKVLGCYCDFPHEDCHGRVLMELREKQKKESGWFDKDGKMVKKKNKNPMLKLAVVGSRTIRDPSLIYKFLDTHKGRFSMVISGGADGPDTFAFNWCKKNGGKILTIFPDWEGEGKKAGMLRNKDIVDEADFVAIFWDGESKGTKHDIDLCKKKNKKHKIITIK